MNETLDLRHQDFCFLGKYSKVNGVFQFAGPTRVAAELQGEIHMREQAPLSLEVSSKVKGEIFCHNLEIYGQFSGKIEATGRVVVHSQAKIEGSILASKLVVFPGAEINIEGHTQD